MKIELHALDGRSLEINEGGYIVAAAHDLRWLARQITGSSLADSKSPRVVLSVKTDAEREREVAEAQRHHEEQILQAADEIRKRRQQERQGSDD